MKTHALILLVMLVVTSPFASANSEQDHLQQLREFTREMDSLWSRDLRSDAVNRANLACTEFKEQPVALLAAEMALAVSKARFDGSIEALVLASQAKLEQATSTVDSVMLLMLQYESRSTRYGLGNNFSFKSELPGDRLHIQHKAPEEFSVAERIELLKLCVGLIGRTPQNSFKNEAIAWVGQWIFGLDGQTLERAILNELLMLEVDRASAKHISDLHESVFKTGREYKRALLNVRSVPGAETLLKLDSLDSVEPHLLAVAKGYVFRIVVVSLFLEERNTRTETLRRVKAFSKLGESLRDSIASTYLYSKAAVELESLGEHVQSLALLREAKSRWGLEAFAQFCADIERRIVRPSFSVEIPQLVVPGSNIPMGVRSRNVDTLFAELLRIDIEEERYHQKQNIELFAEKHAHVKTLAFPYNNAGEAVDVRTLINLGDLESGNWRLMLRSDSSEYGDQAIVFNDFTVSPWTVRQAFNNKFILSETGSGRNVSYQEVDVVAIVWDWYKGKPTSVKRHSLQSSEIGIISISKEQRDLIGTAEYYVSYDGVYQPIRLESEPFGRGSQRVHVYTDNIIYRPGDTIQFAMQSLNIQGVEPTISEPLEKATANINGVDAKVFIDSTSQSLGVTWGYVVVPQGEVGSLILNGDGLHFSIQIAEYRPPKFSLAGSAQIEVISQDSVMLHIDGTLESFSGLSLLGTEILCSGRVAGFMSDSPEFDTLIVGSDGNVHISKLFVRDEDNTERWYWLRGYFSLSYASPYGELIEYAGTAWYGSKRSLEVNVPEWVNRDVETNLTIAISGRTDSLSVFAGSLNISSLKTPVRFKRKSFIPEYTNREDTTTILLYSQQDLLQMFPEDDISETFKKDGWPTKSTAYFNDFVLTGTEVGTHTLRGLAPGWYRYEVIPRELGETEKQTGYFRVFGSETAENIFPGAITVAPVYVNCIAGDNAVLDISTQVDKVYVMQEVVFNNKVVKRNHFELRGNTRENVRRVSLPVPERFCGGFSVVTHTVYNERLYTDVTHISVDWERDNVISVRSDASTYEPSDTAEVVVRVEKPGRVFYRVYDKSSKSLLTSSRFGHHPIRFSIPRFGNYSPAYYIPPSWAEKSKIWARPVESVAAIVNQQRGTEWKMESFAIRGSREDISNAAFDPLDVNANFNGSLAGSGAELPVQKHRDSSIPPRKPMDGWSFWYCDSITDSLTIRVPLPDNIATYVVEAVVISPDLSAGRATAEVSVNLPAMVEVQVPRVLRAGDEIAISGTASLLDSSLQHATVSGTVDVVVYDTQTSNVDTVRFALNPRTVNQGESTRLLWNVALPSNAVSMDYDIAIAGGNRQLDRVQRTQEVEPLLIEVDVRQAYVVGAGDSLNFSITSPRKLTEDNTSVVSNGVRVTSQPLVYVARALPELQHIEFRNSVALTSQAVAAGLQKLLQEKFPAVIAAAAQAPSRSNNLGRFDVSNKHVFNANLNCDSLIEASLDELSSLQKSNGSFSWFHGGDGNAWTTLFVATNLRFIQDELGIDNSELSSMLEDATEYCVAYLRSDSLFSPTAFTSQSRENFVRHNLIHFLAFESEIRATKHGDRHMQRVLDLLRAKWRELSLEELGIYGALVHNTDATLANEILQLIDSKTTTVDNFGTTWEQTDTWKSRTIFGHNNVLAFLEDVQPDHKNIDPGYSWLLSTLRTTHLHNHAMLFVAKRLFTYYGDIANIASAYTLRVDDKTVVDGNIPKEHAMAFEDIAIENTNVSTTNRIEFSNHAKNDMWVDAYRTLITSEVELDARGEHVQISRELTVERLVNGRITTLPYDSNMTLQASDKIKSNLTITTSIPLSFVHVHNPRPQAFEPLQQISGFKWEHRLRYYEAVKNEGTHMFVTDIAPGTYTITDTWQTRFSGTYAMPPATVQCEYAPEYNGSSVGEMVKVNLEE